MLTGLLKAIYPILILFIIDSHGSISEHTRSPTSDQSNAIRAPTSFGTHQHGVSSGSGGADADTSIECLDIGPGSTTGVDRLDSEEGLVHGQDVERVI